MGSIGGTRDRASLTPTAAPQNIVLPGSAVSEEKWGVGVESEKAATVTAP